MPPKRSNKKKAKKQRKQKKGGGAENEKKATPCAATPRLLAARDGNAARIALRAATMAEQVREALRDGADANAQDKFGCEESVAETVLNSEADGHDKHGQKSRSSDTSPMRAEMRTRTRFTRASCRRQDRRNHHVTSPRTLLARSCRCIYRCGYPENIHSLAP